MKQATVLFIVITLNAVTAHALPANPYLTGSTETPELPSNPYLSVKSVVTGEAVTSSETVPTGPSWSLPRLRPHAWKRLLAAAALFPAAAFLHVTAHEASHVATAASYGAVITQFHIGPQQCKPEWGCKWRFGQFRYEDPDHRIDIRKRAFIQAAPLIMDFAVFASTDLIISHYLDDDSLGATVALLSGMIMPLLDFSINVLGPGGDEIVAAAEATDTPKWLWQAAGGAIAVVGIWRVLDQARHLFLAGHRRESKSPNGFAVFPLMSSTTVGLALTGVF